MKHNFPGNIRELDLIERAVIIEQEPPKLSWLPESNE